MATDCSKPLNIHIYLKVYGRTAEDVMLIFLKCSPRTARQESSIKSNFQAQDDTPYFSIREVPVNIWGLGFHKKIIFGVYKVYL